MSTSLLHRRGSSASLLRRRAGVGASLAAVLLLVSACSSTTDDDASTSADAGTVAASGESLATFTVGVDASIHNLDPNQAVSQAQLQILNQIGGTLTAFTDDLSDVEPSLAESWDVSEDGLVYTFHLADGLVFSDGTDLTADDVAASLDRVINDETSANGGMVALWQTVEATDASTVVLTLSAPQPSALSLLADPEIGIITPAASVGNEDFYLAPISAGPYMIESFDATNGDTTLVLNPNWTGATPAVEQLDFVYIEDSNTRIVQLKGGSIDLALNIPPNTLDQLSGDYEGTITSAFGGNFIVANNKSGLLADANIRGAISLALDRERISEVVWGSGAAPMYQFWPNVSVMSDPVMPEGQDIEAAKAMLVGTDCEDGCTINMNIMAGMQSTEDMVALIADDLSQVGITMNIKLTDGAAMGAMMGDFTYDLLISGLYDYVDRADILLAQGVQSDGGTNALFSGYASDTMDSLIDEAISAEGADRDAALAAVNEQFAEDLPLIPIVDWAFVNGQNVSTKQYVTFEPSGWLKVATLDS